MEEKLRSNEQEPQKLTFLKHEIKEFAIRELKKSETIKIITDQFKIKQSTNPNFHLQQFSKNAYSHFITLHAFFQQVISQMAIFPILQKVSLLLSSISLQYFHIFKFSNQKWEIECKAMEELLKNRSLLPQIKSELCQNCSENKWHQHIKSEKHQIFNLRIEDPFYYYNEVTFNQKQVGEEIDHKKLQQKLSELALGVQMQQKCIRQLLENMNQQDEAVNNNLETNSTSNEVISLPIMPMLRSVFHHAKGPKKITDDIGIQTYQVPAKIGKTQESPQIADDFASQRDKIQCKLITQITDKTIKIQELQQKISRTEKSQSDLKAQYGILVQENITLQKRNSVLQVQLNMSKLKQGNNKFKLANTKKSLQKTGEEINSIISKSYNISPLHKQALAQKSVDHIIPAKIRGNTILESKFKVQQTPNKTMFIPNLYQNNQKIFRQSVTPGQLASALSIERGSDQLDDEGLNSVADFPSLRNSIHSNEAFNQKLGIVKFQQNQEKDKDMNEGQIQKNPKQQANKSRRKLKQITKKTINSQAINFKELIKSENQSPDPQARNLRRIGKFQDRQSLLRMLYDSQVKACSDKSLNFDYFKKGYENFVLRIVGFNDADCDKSNLSKLKHLHKKSTVSIKQYFRNDISDSKDQISLNKESLWNDKNQSQSKRYTRFSSCFRNIMNNLFAEQNQTNQINFDEFAKEKIILNNEQIKISTEILAYLIQLKVTNLSAYTKIKTIITIESGQRKKGSNFSEENKELKFSISAIIKNHRRCQCLQGHNYCKHIEAFIKNIVVLMQK